MLIQNCSFEGDEILFISVLAVTNRETAWFRVIVLMAPSVLFPFLVGLQTQELDQGQDTISSATMTGGGRWPKPTNQAFSGFSNKQTDLGWYYSGRTYGCLPCGEGHVYLRKKGTNVPSKDALQDGVSHAPGWWPAPLLPCTASAPFHSVRTTGPVLILFCVLSVACK